MYSGEFANKTILITGSSRGIGKELVKFFCKSEAKVVGISRKKCGIEHRNFVEIICSIKEMEKIEQIIDEYNMDIDILINNAGIISYKNLIEIQREDIEEVFDTNFISTVMLSQMIAKRMIEKRKGGVIINTLSFATRIPSVGSAIYAASKAALESITRTMAAEFIPYGIRVNGYSPGVISTDMTEMVIKKNKDILLKNIAMHEIGNCEQMVRVVAFLASSQAQYLCGCNIDASGGKFIVQNVEQAWENADFNTKQ